METFKAVDINIGYHPDGYRIDKTASAMNRYTRWNIPLDGEWCNPRPVCFDSLPEGGWVRTDGIDWETDTKT